MEWWQVLLIIVVVVALIAIIVAVWFISTHNKLKTMEIKINESESSIDVALTKRHDVLTKMLDATKGYMKHEEKVLIEVTSLRQPPANASMEAKTAFANEQTAGFREINLVAEAYPELKSNTVFMKLQDGSAEVEENLQAARRFYNSNVSIYNQKIAVFPSSIVANSRGFTPHEFFEAEESKRADVKFDFE